ncbi:UNVERIFIED_CONTAM: protein MICRORCHIDIA 4 [Sesamum calycinum]|uniref:Protein MICRORCHIDIA 4 n=1 Tax=Sesamum calycinum TaxID=2727403 RepID=A0AAW2NH67_9LAMI
MVRSSAADWKINVETIVQWSPFSSEADLLRQFNQMQDQGTRIIVYNLWEDDQGMLELDFDTDPHDIQIRGVNRDEKCIDMARKYPNSKHFLTYRHSLRSYAAILYLRIPPNFRIILRGEDVEHHNIVNDMMMSQEITYRPQPGVDGIPKDSNMVAVVTVGFVKDAKAHIDVQGFNVYHKNRLIKVSNKSSGLGYPFKLHLVHEGHASLQGTNSSHSGEFGIPGSDGRGVIGVLEANFVEPAHDKQGFERTTVLARLETRLIQMQKAYWSSNCHKIGYAPRRNKKVNEREISPEPFTKSPELKKKNIASSDKGQTKFTDKGKNNGHLNGKGEVRTLRKRPIYREQSPSSSEDIGYNDRQNRASRKQTNGSSSGEFLGKDVQKLSGLRSREAPQNNSPAERPVRTTRNSNLQENGLNRYESSPSNSSSQTLTQLKEENLQLRERLKRKEEEILGDLLLDLQKEKERCKSLEAQLQEATRKYDELSKEQESLIDIFSEERQRRDIEEENLRKKLKDASITIQQLLDKVRFLEKTFPK